MSTPECSSEPLARANRRPNGGADAADAREVMVSLDEYGVYPAYASAFLDGRISVPGHRVGVILTGGNIDLAQNPWLTGAQL